MSHLRRSVALLCIGLVVFVAITASVAAELAALLTPLWLVCATPPYGCDGAPPCAATSGSLLSSRSRPPRAPPAGFDPVSQPSS